MSEIDDMFKTLSELILTRGGKVLIADEPEGRKIGYIWVLLKDGNEYMFHKTINVNKLIEEFGNSIFKNYINNAYKFLTQNTRMEISEDLNDIKSNIHLLYFSDKEVKNMILTRNMEEALA